MEEIEEVQPISMEKKKKGAVKLRLERKPRVSVLRVLIASKIVRRNTMILKRRERKK